MKKLSFRRRNSILSNDPRQAMILVVLGVVVLVIALLRFVFPGALTALVRPLFVTGTNLTASVGTTGSFFTDKTTLIAERDRLQKEHAALVAQLATKDALIADLTRLVGERTEPGSDILGGVLARPPVVPYDVLLVDAGTRAGVNENARVHGPGGIPLGTVESVTNTSARVVLYSAPGRETEGWVGESRIAVTLHGEGSGALSAMVARESGIAEGDMVYAAGPGARALGTVAAVSADPSSPRSRISIRPLVNPFSITWVSIAP